MKIILGLLLSGTLCAPLFAGNPIDQREQNQKARIRQGVKSGELTRNEARRLLREEAKIRAKENKARSNGQISKKEARKLNRSLDKANRDIFRQKHDNQTQN
jgi:polyhydroxyalkanoate synthesis regulator phasin